MDNLRVLQWNCYSVTSASPDLHTLVSRCSPDVILLQESWLTPPRSFSLRGYHAFRLDRSTGRGGGLLTLVSTRLVQASRVIMQITSPDCELLLLQLTVPGCRPLFLVNVYCPTGFKSPSTFNDVISKVSGRFILAGDFNSHHVMWGSRSDACGRDLWAFICHYNLIIANDGSPTFLRGTSRSVLDLTLLSPYTQVSSWMTVAVGTTSDHLPVYFEIIIPTHRISLFTRLNHPIQEEKFSALLQEYYNQHSHHGTGAAAATAAVSLLRTSITQSSFRVPKRTTSNCAPWWNDDCTRDYRRRKAAWKQLLSNSCLSNWKHFQILKATFKRTVSSAKRAFYTNLNSFLSHPNHRKALHRHIALIRGQPNCSTNELLVLSDGDANRHLEDIARGLATRFQNSVPLPSPPPTLRVPHHDFTAVTSDEVGRVVHSLRASAPGPDGITARTIKFLWNTHPHVLLNIINTSLESSWIPPSWKVARVVVLKKVASRGLALDNIRPIALTSVLCKTVERIIHLRLSDFVEARSILNYSQIGFRRRCSVWMAHVNLDSQIRLAQEMGHFSALVALDIAQAYDSVEHRVLLHRLSDVGIPAYIKGWIGNFLSGRSFHCSMRHLISSPQPLYRGVPQGSILSPLLFNILMSSLPLSGDVLTITYADDIAFFASAPTLHLLHAKAQRYLDSLVAWTRSVCLSVKVQKSAVLLIPPARLRGTNLNIELLAGMERVCQSNAVKYLGVWYDAKMDWSRHIDHIVQKASRALGFIQRGSSARVGMRRAALIHIYKCYVRPIMEYGCILFSHLPDYRIRKLLVLERRALRLCLGLPRFASNDALYLESHVLPLKARFHLLTVSSFLSLLQNPLASHIDCLRDMRSWLSRPWRRANTPQLLFAQSLLLPLKFSLADLPKPVAPRTHVSVQVINIFRPDVKHAPLSFLLAELAEHISQFPNHVVMATDASVSEERAGVGVIAPQLGFQFPIRLPDYTPVYESEFLAIILAISKVPVRFGQVLLLSDSLSILSSLDCPLSPYRRTLTSFVPGHISHIILTWIPGHRGIPLNEAADSLAKMALSGPILDILPPSADVVRARYRRFLAFTARPPARPDHDHLSFAWRPDHCPSRRSEVLLTRFRCLAPPLNFYLHRAGLEPSPACPHCGADETVAHFLLDCSAYVSLRRSRFSLPFATLGVPISLTSLLSFGASHNGSRHRLIFDNLILFITGSNRL